MVQSFLAHANFGPVPANADTEDVIDRVKSYLAMMRKNGQIMGKPLVAKSQGRVQAYANLTWADATLREHHSSFGVRELDELSKLFGAEPIWGLLEDDLPFERPDYTKASALCLFATAYSEASPVHCLDTCVHIPAYMIPIKESLRESLYFWDREYCRLDEIWFDSGDLEFAAYEQLASPTSTFSQAGRSLAAQVEAAISKPVYYYLMRYYGREIGEQDRRCPGCNGAWARSSNSTKSDESWDLPFRCDVCRLVSEHATAVEEAHAHIGEFRTV